LVNHKKYYFSVVAYAYNNWKEFNQTDDLQGQPNPYLEGRRNIQIYTVIPRPIVDRNLLLPEKAQRGVLDEVLAAKGLGQSVHHGEARGGELIPLRHHELRPAGSWNAGIIGYYAGGRVVNLDGLVNNEVYPYLVSGMLRDYVIRKRIRYIVDFESMIEDGRLRRRGGYADGRLEADLRRMHAFPPRKDDRDRSDLVLWEVLPRPELCALQGL